MIEKDEIMVKMKEIIISLSVEESFKSILIDYINEKKDFCFTFGELCLFHYQAFLKEQDLNEEIIIIAAAVELLVLSFDIIDDLQDGDANYIWCKDPAVAINAALIMIFLIEEIINQSSFKNKEYAIKVLNTHSLKSINGQYLDLTNQCCDESSYLQMITEKSGSLTALSCLIGVSLAIGEIDENVKEYGTYIGVIQQIINDIEDLNSWGEKNDLINRKFSLPIIYLFEQKDIYSDTLQKYYSDSTTYLNPLYFEEVLMDSGAINYAIAVKNLYKYKALDIIGNLSLSIENQQYLKSFIE